MVRSHPIAPPRRAGDKGGGPRVAGSQLPVTACRRRMDGRWGWRGMAANKARPTTAGKTAAAKRAAAKRPGLAKTQEAADKQPRAMRLTVPASYRFPTGPKGLLDWSWAQERLTKSQNY